VSAALLSFAQARLPLTGSGRVSSPLVLELRPGSLVVVDPQGSAVAATLADASVGLVAPLGGAVLFQGRDWQAMGAAEAAAARQQIGHCFAGGGWLGHLSMMENVTLAQRHYGLLPEAALVTQAAALARIFGLPGVPMGLPGTLDPGDLARASLGRAFLGRPSLVVLEEPRRDLPAAVTAPLVHAIRRVRDRGGAVLWLTRGPALSEPEIPADARYRLAAGRLIPTRAEIAA
jgi:phospholipid/cholesterol/gamma-HCH transport system ATP-binding protein